MENNTRKTYLYRKLKIVKDSGDIRKIEKSFASGSCSAVTKISKNCDRGDSIAKSGEKVRYTERRLVDFLPRTIRRAQLKEHEGKTKNLKEMKRIKDNYTIRSKYYVRRESFERNYPDKAESDIKNGERTLKLSLRPTSKAHAKHHCCIDRAPKPNEQVIVASQSRLSSVKSHSSSMKADLKRKMPSKTSNHSQQVVRRPIIKTITSKDDKYKVFKAVKFVEKKAQPTQLQITMPTTIKKPKETKSIATKSSVKEKRKKETNAKPILSSDVAVKIKSPPTEIAKWVNVDHAKVYYEAWVDTTLAAISKKVKEKNFDKKKLIKTFEKALAERPASPGIDYKLLLDEQYTGKIRVNKR
ncbi:uncharacterized protein LOC128682017 isoform X2 [Plodia interpunctella]|uniref:uncharacterized protein LOC128682017 isoform X2 n=1 Tax=Plodia interpunctella TaxID=58824 RepID=UPI00236879DF|nr:uncharacterized protein LOC128682017 isoform X2 [Plodia interpunctella]